MKLSRTNRQAGSALVSAAVIAAILSIVVAGLVSYMSNEYILNYRSRDWGQALYLAEAGVDYGIAQFTYQGSGFTAVPSGWASAGGSYTKSISITNTAGQAVGTAAVTVSGVGGSNPKVQAVGTVSAARYGGPSTARAVLATLASSSPFPYGIVAKGAISLSNNPETDSFNSATNLAYLGSADYSSNAAYIYANGDMATNGGNVSNGGNVHGKIHTAPSGTATLGTVGPGFTGATQTTSVPTAEANGWITHDFSTTIPDATIPANFVPVALSGTTIGSGDFYASSLANTDYTITGNARIHLTSTGTTINFSGKKGITIQPGATLTIYTEGAIDLTGQGAINNKGVASNCIIYGMPSCTSISAGGNGAFVGAIYAPQADYSWQGGGSKSFMAGAIVANTISLQGSVHMIFHFDEALKKLSNSGGYSVASWQELRNASSTWVP